MELSRTPADPSGTLALARNIAMSHVNVDFRPLAAMAASLATLNTEALLSSARVFANVSKHTTWLPATGIDFEKLMSATGVGIAPAMYLTGWVPPVENLTRFAEAVRPNFDYGAMMAHAAPKQIRAISDLIDSLFKDLDQTYSEKSQTRSLDHGVSADAGPARTVSFERTPAAEAKQDTRVNPMVLSTGWRTGFASTASSTAECTHPTPHAPEFRSNSPSVTNNNYNTTQIFNGPVYFDSSAAVHDPPTAGTLEHAKGTFKQDPKAWLIQQVIFLMIAEALKLLFLFLASLFGFDGFALLDATISIEFVPPEPAPTICVPPPYSPLLQ